MLLHGEQYLEIRQHPIPTSGTLVSYPRLVDVIDKGTAAIVVTGATTKDAATGEDVFYNESSVFIRGSGGFGGPSKATSRRPAAATASNLPPDPNKPDMSVDEKTTEEQAALYRLSGDRNPLHIDPAFSKVGGFAEPILHGLCFLGISAKHVYQQHGPFRNIKARFAGTVIPGQTLRTEMWIVSSSSSPPPSSLPSTSSSSGTGSASAGAGTGTGTTKIVFQTRVLETGKLCIANAAVELLNQGGRVDGQSAAAAKL